MEIVRQKWEIGSKKRPLDIKSGRSNVNNCSLSGKLDLMMGFLLIINSPYDEIPNGNEIFYVPKKSIISIKLHNYL
ncbi:hypothetical protein IEQ34_003355 [Dendrobium chrysotoxum]|uniref:Uncharacterized protein n=1 Tax=Dendrobium chrysotoxum TaxID=161865 RepID=A0AAV7HIY6_DENCH|nr:hypothetical protein IEQ34_003355 [Dendrobium chrysotoxum]